MRRYLVAILALCTLLVSVAAWTKEDHEVFRLRDEVEASEGPGTTFYDFLGVPPSASQDEINSAYRKKSRRIHPDKARQSFEASYATAPSKPKGSKANKKPGVTVHKRPSAKELDAATKQASERFARLGIVANILRGPQRARYDHFLKNGFPRWRGTGYYYARFRPGLTSVLLGLFVVIGGAGHYGALYLSWQRQRGFVERYVRQARRAAWGDELGLQGIPGLTNLGTEAVSTNGNAVGAGEGGAAGSNRRQRRMQDKEGWRTKKDPKAAGISAPMEPTLMSGPQGTRKRVQAENGKVLIVDSAGNVFLEEGTAEGETHEYLLDVDEIPRPTVYQTAVWRVPVWVWRRTVGRVMGKGAGGDESEDEGEEQEDEEEAVVKSATAASPANEMRKRRANGRIRPQP